MNKEKPNVVVVKVHRNAAGTTIPFDKIYFFRRPDRHLIPRIFGYALVLPINGGLMEAVYNLKPKKVSHLRFRRDDESLRVPTGLDGRKHNKAHIREWWDEQIIKKHNLEDRVAVVPILTSKIRKKLHPRYLNAHRWYERQTTTVRKKRGSRRLPVAEPDTNKLDPAISELAYLATPEPPPDDKIRPICSICPRMMLHLQGKCIPGQAICYKSLDFNRIGAPPDVHEDETTPDTSSSVEAQ